MLYVAIKIYFYLGTSPTPAPLARPPAHLPGGLIKRYAMASANGNPVSDKKSPEELCIGYTISCVLATHGDCLRFLRQTPYTCTGFTFTINY